MKSQKEGEERKNQNKVINMNDYKNKVHKEQPEEVKEKPIGSEPLTPDDLREEIEDAFLMGKQEAVYQTVATFLSTPEAVKYKIIGVEVIIENGYVNCYWKFGERGVPTNG